MSNNCKRNLRSNDLQKRRLSNLGIFGKALSALKNCARAFDM